MEARIFKRSTLILIFLFSAACAKGVEETLPDDPSVEPPASEQPTSPETPADDEPKVPDVVEEPQTPPVEPPSGEEAILAKYDHLDPSHQVPDDLLKKAVLYYDANLTRISNKSYLSVIDFAKKSTLKRFFIIDMKTGAAWAIRVAHGKGSDPEHDGYLNSFSNVSGSNASSRGFYKAAESYSGSHGLSMRLDGLSSTNSNARSRAIVIHGADYVQESSVIQGRSWGCPAVSMGNRDEVVRRLKGGSIIYAGLSGE